MKRAILTVGVGVALAAGLAAQPGPNCDQWNTKAFFDAATVEDATACLAAGADVNARAGDGKTPLHEIGLNTPAVVVEALLAAGADVNARDGIGSTPLHRASSWQFVNFENAAAVIEAIAMTTSSLKQARSKCSMVGPGGGFVCHSWRAFLASEREGCS